MADLMKAVEAKKTRNSRIDAGDTVNVHLKIKGRRPAERIQEFKGTVIRLRKGGNEASFTVAASHPTASAWSAPSCFVRRAWIKWWSSVITRSAALNSISCAERTGKSARLKAEIRLISENPKGFQNP